MKFIHLSDIRIGSPSDSGSHWSSARRDERIGTLQRVLDLGVREGAGLVLISGGLFAHQPVTAELERVNTLLKQYPSLEIVIIAGESDRIRRMSPVISFSWADNVHYILSSQVEQVVLPALKTEVCAVSMTGDASPDAGCFPLADLQAAVSARPQIRVSLREETAYTGRPTIRIAMLRSPDDDKIREVFEKLDFTYVAVGRESGVREILKNKACDPGCLEPETMQESGSHGIYLGEADERDGKLKSLRFIPMASASYIPLRIAVTPRTTAEELEQLVIREIGRRGDKNIYRLKLTGSRDPEEHFDLERLKRNYRIEEILDETEPEYDFETLFAEHPQDMIGYYISRIVDGDREMSPVERKAMYYGIEALLESSREGKSL